jgi:predicted dehydrogenase
VLAVDTSTDARYDGCEDSAQVFVRNAAGVIGSIGLSWTLASSDPAFLHVHGTRGTIDVGWQGSWYRRRGEQPAAFGKGYDKNAAFDAQLDNFARAVSGAGSAAVAKSDAVASVQAIDAAYASIATNGWIEVDPRRVTPFEDLVMEPRAGFAL